MVKSRIAALVAGAAIVFAACSSSGSSPAASGAAPSAGGSAAAGTGCKVGVSWNNYSQERWKKADEPAMQKAIAAAGGSYIRADANDKAEQQLTDIDSLINQGAKALIVLAKDSEAIKPAIAKATAAGIPIIAYDRLIEDPNTFYITFDNKKVGTLMAETLKKLVPSGNYAVILGAETDPNSAFLRSGMTDAGSRSSVTPPARSRSSSRRTPTTGTPPTPRTTWKRRSTRRRRPMTSRPSCPRTTAWPRVWSPPSTPLV